MPTNQNPKHTAKSNGDNPFDFEAMMQRLADPTQLPDKDKLEAMNEAMKENMPELMKLIIMSCYLLKTRHKAFLEAGFTEEQAMELLKAGR